VLSNIANKTFGKLVDIKNMASLAGGRGGGGRKVMTMPIQLIFRFLQSKSVVRIWLYEQTHVKMEGQLIGFDEYMNVVLDNAVELDSRTNTEKALGRIMLRGENITLVQLKPN
jgi:small nuclear ribonucleoprotein E